MLLLSQQLLCDRMAQPLACCLAPEKRLPKRLVTYCC